MKSIFIAMKNSQGEILRRMDENKKERCGKYQEKQRHNILSGRGAEHNLPCRKMLRQRHGTNRFHMVHKWAVCHLPVMIWRHTESDAYGSKKNKQRHKYGCNSFSYHDFIIRPLKLFVEERDDTVDNRHNFIYTFFRGKRMIEDVNAEEDIFAVAQNFSR